MLLFELCYKFPLTKMLLVAKYNARYCLLLNPFFIYPLRLKYVCEEENCRSLIHADFWCHNKQNEFPLSLSFARLLQPSLVI